MKEIDRIQTSSYYREIISKFGTFDWILLTGSQISVLFWKGIILARMKSLDEANNLADELKQKIDSGPYQKTIRIYFLLKGLIEIEKENYLMAINCFKKAYSFKAAQKDWWENHVLYLYPLGLSYFKSGDLQKAQEVYEEIISLTTGRLIWGDLYAKSFYMLDGFPLTVL